MKAGASIVVPALRAGKQLERCLESLAAALSLRSGLDEVLLVDDSGSSSVASWAAANAPFARVVDSGQNLGFARALGAGLAQAQRELAFCLNSDAAVRPGFLEPLAAALRSPEVFAAVPLVLRRGADERAESLVRLELSDGRVRVRQPCVEEPAEAAPPELLRAIRPVPFPLGCAFLARTAELLESGGFDPLFEPFYVEDVDLGWSAWRSGRRCVHVPESVVEHSNQGTIGAVVPPDLALDAIEKNLLLFQWKHLEGEALVEHIDALDRRALDAWLCGERGDLEVLALALEQLEPALAARARLPEPVAPFRELIRRSDPFGA